MHSLIETNPETGTRSLKIPLPPEETIQKIAEIAIPFLSQFLDRSKKSSTTT